MLKYSNLSLIFIKLLLLHCCIGYFGVFYFTWRQNTEHQKKLLLSTSVVGKKVPSEHLSMQAPLEIIAYTKNEQNSLECYSKLAIIIFEAELHIENLTNIWLFLMHYVTPKQNSKPILLLVFKTPKQRNYQAYEMLTVCKKQANCFTVFCQENIQHISSENLQEIARQAVLFKQNNLHEKDFAWQDIQANSQRDLCLQTNLQQNHQAKRNCKIATEVLFIHLTNSKTPPSLEHKLIEKISKAGVGATCLENNSILKHRSCALFIVKSE